MINMRAADTTLGAIPMPVWSDAELPLVLVTVGDGLEEFEALYDHLEAISRDRVPRQQSLIVARPEMPDMLYTVLRARTAHMPNVHIRRLGDEAEHCTELSHESGTFYVTRRRRPRKAG